MYTIIIINTEFLLYCLIGTLKLSVDCQKCTRCSSYNFATTDNFRTLFLPNSTNDPPIPCDADFTQALPWLSRKSIQLMETHKRESCSVRLVGKIGKLQDLLAASVHSL